MSHTFSKQIEFWRELLCGKDDCMLSSLVESKVICWGPPLIKVRIPVNVAEGIVGSGIPAFFVQWITGFRDTCLSSCLILGGDTLEPVDTKKERKAVTETSITATQASICCQKIDQFSSTKSPSVNPEALTSAATHMTKLKHKENPRSNLDRNRIFTFQRSQIGIAMTSARCQFGNTYYSTECHATQLIKSVRTSTAVAAAMSTISSFVLSPIFAHWTKSEQISTRNADQSTTTHAQLDRNEGMI